MPAILRPWPRKSEMKGTKKRPGKKIPEGRLRYAEWAIWAKEEFEVDWPITVAVDTETTGLGWYDEAFCVTMTWYAERLGGPRSAYFELTDEVAWSCCASVLRYIEDGGADMVFHNAKFDLQKLILAGLLDRAALDPRRIHDTEALAHLLDEHQVKRLKFLAKTYLGEETNEYETLKRVRSIHGIKVDDGYHVLPRLVLVPYAMKDTEYTLRLFELFYPQLLQRGDGLPEKYQEEQDLTLVLLDMEAKGLLARHDYLDRNRREYGDRALKLRYEIAQAVGKPLGDNPKAGEFNPGSPAQLLEVFWGRGHALTSTDKATLQQLGDPLADQILELRSVEKMLHTYFEGALREARPVEAVQRGDLTFDLIVHPHYRQHGTRTGRMSSGEAEG